MTTIKYFAYNPECQGALDGHTMHDTWGGAAAEAMSDDGYAWICREITADDLPIRFHILNARGAVVAYSDDKNAAIADATSLSEDGDPHTVRQVADESSYAIGEFGAWVKSRHHGNNSYEPEGVNHPDYTGITGADEESCLREYSERGESGFCHARHHIIVAEATFDDAGHLIDADGIKPSADPDY